MTNDLPALPDPGDGLATLAEAFTIATTWHAQSGSSLAAAIDARNANRPTVAAAHYIAACCCMIVAQTARSVAAQIDPQRGDAEGGVLPRHPRLPRVGQRRRRDEHHRGAQPRRGGRVVTRRETSLPERERRDLGELVLLVAIAVVALLAVVADARASSPPPNTILEHRAWRASTYGWPGDDPYQRLAGCGHRKIGGRDAGQPMPCRLSPRLPIVAHRTWPLGLYVVVCYTKRVTLDGVLVRRCAGARVGDRCGPGCDRNRVHADLSYGLARRIAFPYGIANVTVTRWAPR